MKLAVKQIELIVVSYGDGDATSRSLVEGLKETERTGLQYGSARGTMRRLLWQMHLPLLAWNDRAG